MSETTPFVGPVRTAVVGFLCLVAFSAAVALASRTGVLDAGLARRAIGVIVGLMMIVTGNLLPKMRPLRTLAMHRAPTTTAERTAGWILVLAGMASVSAFVLAPLAAAKSLMSALGFGALAAIAVSWLWLGVLRRDSAVVTTPPNRRASKKRDLIVWLLFGFLYVLITACIAFGFGAYANLAPWLMVAFGAGYAAVAIVLERRPSVGDVDDGEVSQP